MAYGWILKDSSSTTVNVSELIPCENCIYYQKLENIEQYDGKICRRLGFRHGKTKPHDFCSYGEKNKNVSKKD